MSGPKYSRAVIETARMLILIQQINSQIEECKCHELEKSIQNEMSRFRHLRSKLNDIEIESLIQECDSFIPDNQILIKTKTTFEETKKMLINEAIGTNSKSMAASLSCIEKINHKLQENVVFLNGIKDELSFQLDKAKIQEQILSKSNIVNKLRFEKARSDTDLKELSFENKDYDNNLTKLDISNSKLKSLYEEVFSLAEQCEDSDKQKEVLKSIIENDFTDESYKIKQLQFRKSLFNFDSSEINKELDAEIVSLRQMLNISEISLPEGEQRKQEECKRLRKMIEEKTSDDYINKSINEVMEECGYSIIRNDTVKTPARSISRSLYDFSSNSVIQAAVSDNGAVILEVMGKKEVLSDSDKASVVQDMQRFCPDYNIVKERLRKRGIILTNENLFPADAQYVRSIPLDDAESRKNRRGVRKKEHLYVDD